MERRRKKKPRRRNGFTAAEQSFFEAGERMAEARVAPADSFDDLEDGRQAESFWTRLSRRQLPA